jgi:hypothetical protein
MFHIFPLLRAPPIVKNMAEKGSLCFVTSEGSIQNFNMKLQAIPTLQEEATLEGPSFLQRKLLFQNMCGYVGKASLGFVTSEALIQKLIELNPSYKMKLG